MSIRASGRKSDSALGSPRPRLPLARPKSADDRVGAASTAVLKRLGRVRYGELLLRQNTHLRSVFERSRGNVVDRQGDAFFAVFRSAGAAIAGARARGAQRVLSSRQACDLAARRQSPS